MIPEKYKTAMKLGERLYGELVLEKGVSVLDALHALHYAAAKIIQENAEGADDANAMAEWLAYHITNFIELNPPK